MPTGRQAGHGTRSTELTLAEFSCSYSASFHELNRMYYDWSVKDSNCLCKPLLVLP